MTDKSNIIPFPGQRTKERPLVSLDRRELGAIMSIYGRMVAAGEWRDYALNMGPDVATFSVFRRTGEVPAYRIEKRPKNAAKQGAYTVIDAEGRVLKRGHDLALVMRIFNRKLLKLADEV